MGFLNMMRYILATDDVPRTNAYSMKHLLFTWKILCKYISTNKCWKSFSEWFENKAHIMAFTEHRFSFVHIVYVRSGGGACENAGRMLFWQTVCVLCVAYTVSIPDDCRQRQQQLHRYMQILPKNYPDEGMKFNLRIYFICQRICCITQTENKRQSTMTATSWRWLYVFNI